MIYQPIMLSYENTKHSRANHIAIILKPFTTSMSAIK